MSAPQTEGGSRPLHVLFVSSPFTRMTGADRDGVTLTRALDGTKVRVTWAGCRGSGYLLPHLQPGTVTRLVEVDLPALHQLMQEQQEVARSPWLWTKIVLRAWQHNRAAARQLKEQLREDPPDLVVTNSAALQAGALYARSAKIPHIWCVKEWLNPQILPSRRFARFILENSALVTVPSRACATIFEGAPTGRVRVVHDGSEVGTIVGHTGQKTREELLYGWGLPLDKPLVVQSGAFQHWKGQHIALRAFTQLCLRRPEVPCSLVFLGGDGPGDVPSLEEAWADTPASVRQAVRFARYAPGDYAALAAADLVLHPSVLPDPLPNAVREAMILGRAVLASDSGGPRDMVQPGVTGELAPPGDVAAWSEALEKLLDNAEGRERLGLHAAQEARTHYDAGEVARIWTRLFEEIYERGNP